MFASDNIQYDFVTFFGWSLSDLIVISKCLTDLL